MKFALRAWGVPAEITDHLDLKAHADPTLSSSENVDNFLSSHPEIESYRRSAETMRHAEAMALEAQDRAMEDEVERRVEERVKELALELGASSCGPCESSLRVVRGQLVKARAIARRTMSTCRAMCKRGELDPLLPGTRARAARDELAVKLRAKGVRHPEAVASIAVQPGKARGGSKVYRRVQPLKSAAPKSTSMATEAVRKAAFIKAAAAARAAGKPKSAAYKSAFREVYAKAIASGRSAASSVSRRAASGFKSLTVGNLGETYLFLDGLKDAYNGYRANRGFYSGHAAGGFGLLNNGQVDWNAAAAVVVPAVDGGLAALAVHEGLKNDVTAPRLVRAIAQLRPFAPKLPTIRVGDVVDGAPSLAGWSAGIKSFREIKNWYAANGIRNPRTAAITGLQIGRKADGKIGLLPGKNGGTIADRAAYMRVSAPVIAGGVASKGVHLIRTSSMAPTGARKVMAIRVIRGS